MQRPVTIIDSQNRRLYKDTLEDMYRMRGRVARRFNWAVPWFADGVDRDDFDRDDTVYLLLLNDHGRVAGCSRLNITTRPHLIDTVFPEYCDSERLVRSPSVWEFSRMFVDRDMMDLKAVVRSCYLLMSGVAELCVAHGLSGVTWYTSMPNYQAALACWRQTVPMGRPALHRPDNVIYVPAYSPIDQIGLTRIKERARHTEEVTGYQRLDGRWVRGSDVDVFQHTIRADVDAA